MTDDLVIRGGTVADSTRLPGRLGVELVDVALVAFPKFADQSDADAAQQPGRVLAREQELEPVRHPGGTGAHPAGDAGEIRQRLVEDHPPGRGLGMGRSQPAHERAELAAAAPVHRGVVHVAGDQAHAGQDGDGAMANVPVLGPPRGAHGDWRPARRAARSRNEY